MKTIQYLIILLSLAACNKQENTHKVLKTKSIQSITVVRNETDTIGIFTFEYTGDKLNNVYKNNALYAHFDYQSPNTILIATTYTEHFDGNTHYMAIVEGNTIKTIYRSNSDDTIICCPFYELDSMGILYTECRSLFFISWFPVCVKYFNHYNFDFERDIQGDVVRQKLCRFVVTNCYTLEGFYDTIPCTISYSPYTSQFPMPAQMPIVDYFESDYHFISPLYLLSIAGYNLIPPNYHLIAGRDNIMGETPFSPKYSYKLDSKDRISTMRLEDYFGLPDYTTNNYHFNITYNEEID